MARIELTLAHSPDPDDACLWWPITGCIDPAEPSRVINPPVVDTGRWSFRAVPADIERLNRRAVDVGDHDITAMSVHAYPHARHRYAVTACGASMGMGYGPKLVARAGSRRTQADWLAGIARGDHVVAVPGVRTTAFLTLRLMVFEAARRQDPGSTPSDLRGRIDKAARFVEVPFEQIIGMVAVEPSSGRTDAAGASHPDLGLVIHEGQLTFEDAGLELVSDLGAWWMEHEGLPMPLGLNAVRADLDDRFGTGSLVEVASLLERSIRHALDHWELSIDYAMGFAMANSTSGVTRERVERFVRMYVNDLTLDMGESGRRAVQTMLDRGHQAGLCPDPGLVTIIGGAGLHRLKDTENLG